MVKCTHESGKHCWERGCFVRSSEASHGLPVGSQCETCFTCDAPNPAAGAPSELFAKSQCAPLTDAPLTDAQLRAECERRGLDGFGPWFSATVDELKAERDEWRRRAEAAEAQLPASDAMPCPHCARRFVSIVGQTAADGVSKHLRYAHGNVPRSRERGPGIAAMREDTSLDVDPLDLLCDDE